MTEAKSRHTYSSLHNSIGALLDLASFGILNVLLNVLSNIWMMCFLIQRTLMILSREFAKNFKPSRIIR